jgi:hypothetical protein
MENKIFDENPKILKKSSLEPTLIFTIRVRVTLPS